MHVRGLIYAVSWLGLWMSTGACGTTVTQPTPAERCEAGGGTWSAPSCTGSGDWCAYLRGERLVCEQAFGPGCACGPGECWEPAEGRCRSDDDVLRERCEASGATWAPDVACEGRGGQCGSIGLDCPDAAPAPGCVCPEGECRQDGACVPYDPTEALCVRTGGRWAETDCDGQADMCGHIGCFDVSQPGCDCGAESCFSEEGCTPWATYREAECLATGGTWTTLSCEGQGDVCFNHGYSCGEAAPGCDCGPGRCSDESWATCEEGTTPAERCAATGGSWEPLPCAGLEGACKPWSPEDCADEGVGVTPACRCPDGACWQLTFGCSEP